MLLRLLVVTLVVALASGCSSDTAPNADATPTRTATAGPTPTSTAPAAASSTPRPTPTVPPLNLSYPLLLAEVASGEVRTLPLPNHDARWSPDSRHLVYVSRERDEVLLLDVDTLDVTTLAVPGAWEAVWTSPALLAVASRDRRGVDAFDGIQFITAPRGQVLAQLAASSAEDLRWSDQAQALLYRRAGRFNVWSPGVAFQVEADGQSNAMWLGDGTIAVLTFGGSAAVRVYDPRSTAEPPQPIAELREIPEAYFAISPDGRYAIYDSWERSGYEGVVTHIVEVAGGTEVRQFPSTGSFVQSVLNWSPDGRNSIALRDMCGPDESIVTLNVDGTVSLLDTGFAYSYAWSPDGSRVAYSKSTDLWIADVERTIEPRQLILAGVHGPATPVWSPDGRYVAVWTMFGGYGRCE